MTKNIFQPLYLVLPIAMTLSAFACDNTDSQPRRSQVCYAVVTGNIRSEPTSSRNNIIREGFGKAFQVAKKETPGGWLEIYLPDDSLGWAHRSVIRDEEGLDRCLKEQNIELVVIPDIYAPRPDQPINNHSPEQNTPNDNGKAEVPDGGPKPPDVDSELPPRPAGTPPPEIPPEIPPEVTPAPRPRSVAPRINSAQ